VRVFRNLTDRRFVVGVGAQKAGTTWLYDYLGRHRDVAMSPIKELHYFDQVHRPDLCSMWPKEFERQTSDLMARLIAGRGGPINSLQYYVDRVRMNADPSAYLEYFDRLATHGRPVVGEITPSYSLLPETGFAAIRRMLVAAETTPRIVFVMRDPAERFWSQCRFEAAASPQRSPNALFDRALGDPNFLERTRYDLTVPRLKAVFPPTELLFIFYEDLFLPSSIERLCDFLGIAFVMPNTGQRIHASMEGRLDTVRRQRLKEILAPVYAFAEGEFGDRVPLSWRMAR
jgi:hypothetical protein